MLSKHFTLSESSIHIATRDLNTPIISNTLKEPKKPNLDSSFLLQLAVDFYFGEYSFSMEVPFGLEAI